MSYFISSSTARTAARTAALTFAVWSVVNLPLSAQEDEGRSLMERGAELFFEGLKQEMSPALDELRDMAEQFGPSMQGFFTEMGPAFAEVLEEVKDWSRYHPPEILPNGDIIMRRKADLDDEGEDDGEDAPEASPPPAGSTDI